MQLLVVLKQIIIQMLTFIFHVFSHFSTLPSSACYTIGHVTSGLTLYDFTSGSDCPRPLKQQWYNIRVYVSQSEASFYLDDDLVREGQSMHHNKRAIGGLFVPNGYDSRLTFKNPKVYILP